MLSSYVKIYNLGHKAIVDLFKDPVIIEEKIDGSQFSFGIIDGRLQFRSHHCEVFPENAGMFQKPVNWVIANQHLLHEGWIYRGEFLSKLTHNTLTYERIPQNNIIIFDIDMGTENYMNFEVKKIFANSIGLEVVPQFIWTNQEITNIKLELFKGWLDRESILGGTTIEGLVIKNYHRFGIDGHCLMGKYVSEKFKEKHQKNPEYNKKSFIENLTAEYTTEARWQKAVQHLKEQGLLLNEPKDIGILLKEIDRDVLEECSEEIKEKLFNYWWRQLRCGLAKGFPEWYKQQLLEKQFKNNSLDKDP